MSVSASCESVSQEKTLSSLIASRVVKKPKLDDGQRLQEAAIQLLEQQQNLCSLLKEVGTLESCKVSCLQREKQKPPSSKYVSSGFTESLLADELRRQASRLGVPVASLSVKTLLERLMEIIGGEEKDGDGEERRELLTSCQRVQVCLLLESSKELMSQGAFCPKLFWQEYRRDQKLPKLEFVYHLHVYSILSLKYILESDEDVKTWLASRLKALCGWTPPQDEEETKQVQRQVLSMVAGVLVGSGFERNQDRRISLISCSVLDEMLFWFLDVAKSPTLQSAGAGSGSELWIQVFDASLCGVSASADALQRFFKHSLTQTLTYKPQLTVSDAIAMQNEWMFAKSSRLLTSLFRKLSVIFSVEQLLRHLQQVLETHEVNWQHVLSFVSTLLVHDGCAQNSLRELLSRLLTSAFEGYDLENMITAFLLARQGALEGTGVFSSYSDWFKMSFGGGSSYHATSKKSLVFLLKFLSDLVPFEPPQYLKVHILHPPYTPMKHRGLLMEYISLAKTRLADLKESVEDMGLYEDVSAAGGASAQPVCQAVQDVDKALSLFTSTGRISAAVMEASIFRRPYFLTRFLPALLTPRVLPVKADNRMSFIEALKKADKIPAAQYSSYIDACHRQRQKDSSVVCLDAGDDPLEVLNVQLQVFTNLVADGDDGEMSAQLSRISHTLSVIFPGRHDDLTAQTVVTLRVDVPASNELHVKVVNVILRNFCQCLLDASRLKPPNKQNQWASSFVSVLLANGQLISVLIHRLWDLLHNQAASLSPAHLLGLAAFTVHLHVSTSSGPLVQMVPPIIPQPVLVGEALASALTCNTSANMRFCIRFCVAAVSYAVCRGDSLPEQQRHDYVPSSLYKKLLYLVPRLLPETRRNLVAVGDDQEENPPGLWTSVTDGNNTWRRTASFLWRHAAFYQLQHKPQYQLPLTEWLVNELRVNRGEDALSDPERQEYQQWACLELYWCRPEEQGGCGGDAMILCSHVLDAVMEQQLRNSDVEKSGDTGTCLPDILSRLQELVYETEVTNLSGSRSRSDRVDFSDFLFDFVSRRRSGSPSLSCELVINAWNSVMLALPAAVFVKVKDEGGRTTLDCDKLIQHINQHQRQVCSPSGLLSCRLVTHFLKGLLSASVRCRYPREEVNRAWSQISLHCPLLLTSTAWWWPCVSPGLLSLWKRVCDDEVLSDQLQLVSDCHLWADGLENPSSSSIPSAPALLLASSLYRTWRRRRGEDRGFAAILNVLRPQRDAQQRQVLVFLLFLCVSDHLSSLLYPQEEDGRKSARLCSELLPALVDSPDWLLVFKSNERGVYRSVAMVTSDEHIRLMPWAFYSLLLQQDVELLHRATRCPGFLHTAVACYVSLLQLFLEGQTPTVAAENSGKQSGPSQILNDAKQFLLRVISQTSGTALSSSQLRQLESQCSDLDPEVAAALSLHLNPPSLSPEMDFL